MSETIVIGTCSTCDGRGHLVVERWSIEQQRTVFVTVGCQRCHETGKIEYHVQTEPRKSGGAG
jgi:hypothetical protein